MQKRVKKLLKVMAGILAVILFVGVFTALSNFGSMTALAADDGPDHGKYLTDNGDGTFTLELTVTGDADTEVETAANVNVVVVYDTSSSMTRYRANGGNSGPRRADAAEFVIHEFTENLFEYQSTTDPTNIQLAIVAFDHSARTVVDWNNSSNENYILNRLSATGAYNSARITGGYSNGTNWEDAMKAAENLLNSSQADDDPTFVIFFTDGMPSQRTGTPAGTYYNEPGDHAQVLLCAQNAATVARRIENRDDTTVFGIYGYGNGQDYLDDVIYFSQTGSHRNPESTAIVTDGIGDYYFNATDTAALESAIESIFQQVVQALGISSVSITDGTTNQVETSTGTMSELLEIVPNSYQYWLSIPLASNQFTRIDLSTGEEVTYTVTDNNDGTCTVTWGTNTVTVNGKVSGNELKYEWTEANALYNYSPPAAEFTNGAVNWNLSSVGTLLDGVTYSVTFDVYPSQTTLDIVADIRNNPGAEGAWGDLDENIQQYIDVNGNLSTNTTATLTYMDTRTGENGSATYDNPDPVPSSAVEQLAVAKDWENELDSESEETITLYVMRDDETEHVYEVNLSKNSDPEWTGSVFISVGIMGADGTPLRNAEGHDFTFAEPENINMFWEIDVPTVHPMLIDGELTVLVKVDAAHPVPEGTDTADIYTINGAQYYVDEEVASLRAMNERRSSVVLTKAVTGDGAPADAVFPFTLNVVNARAASGTASNTNSDYYVRFVVENSAEQPVTDAVVSGATSTGSGQYYAQSGANVLINMRAGYRVRLIDLPKGSTYTFTEGNLPAGFIFDSSEISYTGSGTEDTSFSGGRTTTGTVQSTNTIYTVTYTNEYTVIDVTVDKVWDDASDQDGIRPETLTLTLNGLPTGVTAPTPTVAPSTDGNTWTYTWAGLPKYDASGEEIEYTITEGTVPEDYTCTTTTVDAGGTITNVHTPSTIDVTVTKVWDDNSDQDGMRPETLTLTLNGLPDGVEAPTPTVTPSTDGNSWAYTWAGVPENSDGEAIEYTITEGTVPQGYTCTTTTVDAGGTITNVHTPSTIDVTVDKVWDDNSDQDGMRPETLTLTLNGLPTGVAAPAPTVVPSADGNSWTYTWAGVPEYSDGEAIEYTITEGTVPQGYTCTTTTVDAGGTITNVHTPSTIDVTVDKVWDDNFDQDGIRPDTLTLTLNGLPDGVTAPEPSVVENGSTWTYTWEGVPEFSGGEEIEYTITEETVPTDYTCETTTVAAGGTITNVHTPSTIDVIVTKVWDDASDQDGLRPETLTLTMGDVPEGVDVPEPTVAKDGDTWTYTWAGMPENSFGNPIEYIITEETVPAGYTCETTTVAAGGTITNVHTPATIVIEITKVWDDAFAPDGMRPTPEEFAGMLTLSAEPTVTGIDGYAPAVTVDPDDPDAYIITYTGLPAYVNKTAVTYTVTESAIPGYTTAQASATDGGTITNVYAPTSVIVDPPVQKIFVGDEEQALYNQGDFTFTIEAAEWPDGLAAEDVPMPVNTSITNSPNYERSDKPGYYEFGEIEFTVPGTYVYTVSEAGSVEGVTNDSEPSKTLTFVVDDNGEGALIVTPDTDSVQLSFTNTYTPPGTFTVIKNWVGDTADVRPEGIDVTVVATVTLPDKPELQLEEDPEVVDETAESENDEDLTVPADETDPADPAEDETDVPQTEGAADEADVPQTEGAADEADVSQTEGAADEADVPQAANTADDDAAVELSMKRDENEEVQTEYTWEFRMTADEQTQDGVWEHMIELPRLPEGATITFTVTEGEVAGYTTEIEVNDEEMYAEITNTLVPTPDPATVTLTATKVLDGRELAAGEFSFQLLDAGGNVVETVTNAADGAVTFSTLEFAEAGKYSFTIVEVAGEEGGVTYDTQSFGVTVTVTDEGKSALTAEVSYENGNPVFRNTYVPAPTTASITARKVLTGRTLAANEFSFQLLDAEGNVIETVKNAADGSIAFSAITYDAAGEYTYTIVEVIPTEKEEGMTYDTHRYGVTVTVTDDGQGSLAAEVTYTSGTPVFSNIYVPAGPPTGDSSHGALFGVIALAAAAVCAGAFAVSRRRAR